ncbi:hypothetical protein BJX76DRAFT_338227 [Aspergillus varians]
MRADDGSAQLTDSPSSQSANAFSLPAPLAPGVRLNPDLIYRPDPITLYFSFFGTRNWHRKIRSAVSRVAEAGSVDINRPLTQSELDFHVENTSKSIYQARLGFILGLQVGAVHAARWERNGKVFDRYAPKKEGLTPAARYLEGIKNMYKLDPTMFRSSAVSILSKVSIWAFAGWIFSTTYAVSSGIARMATDPRIKDFFEERKNQDPRAVQERQRQALLVRSYSRGRQTEQEVGASSAQEESSEQSWSEGPSDTSASEPSSSAAYNYNAPTEKEKDGGFFDDDASPIAPEHRDTALPGSAWDRIRRQNQPQYTPTTQTRTPRARPDAFEANETASEDQDTTSQGGAWGRLRPQGPAAANSPGRPGVSDGSSDSQLEREQAQARFDQMLDAERRKANDSDPGSRRGAW